MLEEKLTKNLTQKLDNDNKIKPKQVEIRNLAGFNEIENKKIKMQNFKKF